MLAAVRYGPPAAPDYEPWQTTAGLIALAVVSIGLLVAWRWEGIGGSLALVGGISVGALAALEYHPLLALLAAIAFAAPAVLFLLAWQRTRSVRSVLALGSAVLVLLAAGGAVAQAYYQRGFGPAHPQSPLVAPPPSAVSWVWSGAVTDASAVVVADVPDAGAVRLIVSRDQNFAAGESVDPATTGEVYRFDIAGLDPAATYHYAIEADGALDLVRAGRFTTFATGPFSFEVAVGSCARLGSNGAVFDTIRELDPDLFLVPGDLFYADVYRDDPDAFFSAYRNTLTAASQAALYREVPIAYVWDDHDFGPDNAASDSPSRAAALTAYAELVPHYPLRLDGDGPIAQAFTIGRVRFILTDLRSARSRQDVPDGPAKTMLGEAQRAWFEAELIDAAARYPAVFWVSSVPWIGLVDAGADNWAGYAWEREQVALLIAEHGIDNLVMIAGDAHMVAIDDGSNGGYAPGGGGFPVLHAAALDRPGSLKGGPYSEGAFPGGGQFGLVKVIDDGGNGIVVSLHGLTWEGQELASLTLEFPAPAVAP
jgi:phosphodiesterase/alkaline phosphatase D-like protein